MPLSPSTLRNYLDCEQRVWMDLHGDTARRHPVSAFQQLLFDEGLLHERQLVERAARTTPIVDLSELSGDAKEAATRDWAAKGAPLIYQGRLSADNLVGEPDLLRREAGGYTPIDIKSGSALEDDGGPKLKYGAQIALYVELLEGNGLSAGPYGYVWARNGDEIRYELDAPLTEDPAITLRSKYRALLREVEPILAGNRRTTPAAGTPCKQCVWKPACHEELEAADDLTLLSELGRAKRTALQAAFPTVQALADADLSQYLKKSKGSPFPGLGAATLKAFQAKARLAKHPAAGAYLREHCPLPAAELELFFDIEDCTLRHLVYLHGFVIREGGNCARERFVGIFADRADVEAERDAFSAAMAVFREHAGGLIVYFSMHERTKYRELQRRFPNVCSVDDVEGLFATGRSLDLMAVAKKAIWPTRDNTVKSLAQYRGFRWRDENPSGAASVEWFHRYVTEGDVGLRQRILDYNEDDCRAMRVVLDRMRKMEVKQMSPPPEQKA